MQNRKPTSLSECKEALKFLDYLRKSQCTQTGAGSWKYANKDNECRKTIANMEEVAKECIEISNNKLKS